MKTRSVVAELFHADGQTDGRTDMMNLRVAFQNFVHASKNELYRHSRRAVDFILYVQKFIRLLRKCLDKNL